MVNALMTSISREPDCDVDRRDWRWPLYVDTRQRPMSQLRRVGMCVVFAHLTQPYQPSPKLQSGRPAHRPFRGLLGVHSRCGPNTRAVAYT